MNTLKTRTPSPLALAAVALLALLALVGVTASTASAAGPGRLVFVAGKARHCHMGACRNFDLVRSIGPHGGPGEVLAKVRSAVETASAENGTVAVLSKVVAGGGANSDAFTQVYLITPAGKRVEVFPHRLQGFNATGLGISGNGKLLALSGHYTAAGSEPSKIWLVRSDGTGMRQLTEGPGNDETPSLSPDGKRVVFSRTLSGDPTAHRKPELYVADTSGGEPVRLTENAREDVNPIFSPDGRNVAFGQVTKSRGGSVAVIGADGAGLRTVTSTGGEYPDPDYSPNGRNLVFVGEMPHVRGYESALYTVRVSGAGRALASSAFEAPGLPQWTVRP